MLFLNPLQDTENVYTLSIVPPRPHGNVNSPTVLFFASE